MLSEPISLTYNAVAKSLARSGSGVDSSEYRLLDGTTATYLLRIGHTLARRNRYFVRLQRDAYATDPVIPAQNVLTGAVCTMSVDYNPIGTTATEARNLALALTGYLTSGNLDKIIGGET